MVSSSVLATWVSYCLLLLIAMPHGRSEAAKYRKMKETKMVFYMQDYETGKKQTAAIVAGINGTKWDILTFGTVFVTGDDLTEGPERNSTKVGEARGLYLNSALDGSDLHLVLSVVFTNKKYNGSTLEIQGSDRFYLKQREVSIVSGTGAFRFARGYAILETTFLDIPSLNAVIKYNVTLLHY